MKDAIKIFMIGLLCATWLLILHNLLNIDSNESVLVDDSASLKSGKRALHWYLDGKRIASFVLMWGNQIDEVKEEYEGIGASMEEMIFDGGDITLIQRKGAVTFQTSYDEKLDITITTILPEEEMPPNVKFDDIIVAYTALIRCLVPINGRVTLEAIRAVINGSTF